MPRSVARTRAWGLISWAAKMPLDRREVRVAVQQLQVAGELLDAVDLTAPLDLDRDGRAVRVPAQDVDGPDGRHVLAPDERVALAEGLDAVGEEFLEVRLDAVLDQAGVDAQFVRGVVEDLLHRDDELLARLVDDGPDPLLVSRPLLQSAGRRHPVEGLVGPVVRVDRDAAVRLHQDQTGGRGEMGGEPARVVDGAAGNDETHGRQRYSTGGVRAIRPPDPVDRSHAVRKRACPSCALFGIGRLCSQSPGAVTFASLTVETEVASRALCVFGRELLPVRQTPARRGGARGEPMSLDVSPALLEQAERGEVDEAEFVDCVRTSLPYAWEMISSLVAQLKVDGGEFADNQTPPPDEQARGQLLRALASDAIRGALQRHFGVRLAFQNCHRVAVFPLDPAVDEQAGPLHLGSAASCSTSRPELRDC